MKTTQQIIVIIWSMEYGESIIENIREVCEFENKDFDTELRDCYENHMIIETV